MSFQQFTPFLFLAKDKNFKNKWIKFIDRKDWQPFLSIMNHVEEMFFRQ